MSYYERMMAAEVGSYRDRVEARKARLQRMGALPRPQAKVIPIRPAEPKSPIINEQLSPKFPMIGDIQRAACEYYGLRMVELISARRTKQVVRPRWVAMYMCRQLTPKSYPEIGRRFGDRDHATVLHAVRSIEAMRDDPEISAAIAHFEAIFA